MLTIPPELFSMEVLEQHNQLFEQLQQAKAALDPIVALVNEREHLLELQKELESIMKDPSRYTDRRYSNKMWGQWGIMRSRLNRQRALEREVKRIPLVDRQLIPLIGDYELHNGEIVVNGESYLRLLKEEEEAYRPRSVEIGGEGDA